MSRNTILMDAQEEKISKQEEIEELREIIIIKRSLQEIAYTLSNRMTYISSTAKDYKDNVDVVKKEIIKARGLIIAARKHEKDLDALQLRVSVDTRDKRNAGLINPKELPWREVMLTEESHALLTCADIKSRLAEVEPLLDQIFKIINESEFNPFMGMSKSGELINEMVQRTRNALTILDAIEADIRKVYALDAALNRSLFQKARDGMWAFMYKH